MLISKSSSPACLNSKTEFYGPPIAQISVNICDLTTLSTWILGCHILVNMPPSLNELYKFTFAAFADLISINSTIICYHWEEPYTIFLCLNV